MLECPENEQRGRRGEMNPNLNPNLSPRLNPRLNPNLDAKPER